MRGDKTIFDRVRRELGKYNISEVSEYSGVHRYTLYDWLKKETPAPRIDTLTKVADAIGFDIVLERREE